LWFCHRYSYRYYSTSFVALSVKLSVQRNETKTKQFQKCFKTVLFLFHFVVRTVLNRCVHNLKLIPTTVQCFCCWTTHSENLLLQKSSCFQYCCFLDIDMSLGSVAKHLTCSGIFIDSTSFLLLLTVQKV